MIISKAVRLMTAASIAISAPSLAYYQAEPTETRTADELDAEAARLVAEAEALRDQAHQARVAAAIARIEAETEALRQGAEARAELVRLGESAPPQPGVNNDDPGTEKDESNNPLSGFGLGAGIAYVFDTGRNDRIAEADLVGDDQIVRVRRLENASARLIVETHYFFTPCGEFLGLARLGLTNECSRTPGEGNSYRYRRTGEANWGIGPFIAVQPDSSNIIDAIGGGIMIGLRRPGSESQSFNFGMGYLVDVNAQILGEGIVANEPLPEDEDGIRFQERAQGGVMLITSYTF
jgi:hypothetical protein